MLLTFDFSYQEFIAPLSRLIVYWEGAVVCWGQVFLYLLMQSIWQKRPKKQKSHLVGGFSVFLAVF
jgi:hypothetical protein